MGDPEKNLKGLIETVQAAHRTGEALEITGNGTKGFYGREVEGQRLSLAEYRWIIAYEPTELVITARAGTPLDEFEAALSREGQMLGFEPPRFGNGATLGGTVACGLSGPRRPYAGAVRDFVLGVKCINGQGEVLRFGGQVMKNVAGFDISRLMVGAMGTLGILLEVSLKVLPKPETELTLQQKMGEPEAIEFMNRLAGQPWPLSAACHYGGVCYLRLSGMESAVRAASRAIGGDVVPDGVRFWEDVREQRHPFFLGDQPLWRLSVPPATPIIELDGDGFIEWGGAQRWYKTGLVAEAVRQAARAHGGHATLFRGGDRQGEVFTPLSPAMEKIHRRLKTAFDPKGILNSGRLYSYL
jgi:glycolate oxidase FAD binding subunit